VCGAVASHCVQQSRPAGRQAGQAGQAGRAGSAGRAAQADGTTTAKKIKKNKKKTLDGSPLAAGPLGAGAAAHPGAACDAARAGQPEGGARGAGVGRGRAPQASAREEGPP
jgi:hypothetical protein